MKRRHFLHSAGTLGAVMLLPAAAQAAAGVIAPSTAARFTLLRSASGERGARFEPHASCAAESCNADTLRVRMDGLHVAAGSRLRGFSLSALFDADDGVQTPFLAWHYGVDGGVRMSQRMSFVAGRASMRGFALDYRHEGDIACRTQACALTRFEAPLLAPGHYVLVDAAAPGALAHGGDPLAPLGERGFDYLAFRIEPLS
jgi:hypothetical protein